MADGYEFRCFFEPLSCLLVIDVISLIFLSTSLPFQLPATAVANVCFDDVPTPESQPEPPFSKDRPSGLDLGKSIFFLIYVTMPYCGAENIVLKTIEHRLSGKVHMWRAYLVEPTYAMMLQRFLER